MPTASVNVNWPTHGNLSADGRKGLETLLVKAASRLSGGQRQRIAIGRALLYNPDFLLFDEATSTLDMVSEGLVKEALDSVLLGRTTIFHRTLTFHR